MASCTNCGGKLLRGAMSCPQCGVFAGEEQDGRPLPPRSYKALWISLLLLALLGGAVAAWRFLPRRSAPPDVPVRVVRDRPGGVRRAPGAAVNEAEAVRILRRHLITARKMKSECLAVIGKGHREGGYLFLALDSCRDTRLGQWRVDAKSGATSAR